METQQPVNKPIPSLETTSTAEPLAGVGDISDKVKADAARNVPLPSKTPNAETQTPAASGRGGDYIKPKFLKMPAELFQFGEDGKPIVRRGVPVFKNKKGGRPRKPREGEKLLDGSTFKGGDHTSKPNVKPRGTDASVSAGPGRIIDPTRPDPSQATAPQVAAEPVKPGVELGPEAGEVIADIALNTTEAAIGEPPTDAERASIRRSASAVASGWRLHPLIAVFLFTAAYVGRVMLKRWTVKETTESGKPEKKPDAHSNSGPDGKRKDGPSKKAFKYGE